MINRLMFTRFIEKPFWFLDGKIDGADVTGDTSFPERLQYLYKRYYEASPINAIWWRMVTLGLANLKIDQTPKSPLDKTPYEFGDENRKRQADTAENLADQLLADSLFQLLLRDLADAEEKTDRRQELVNLLQAGAEYLTEHEVTLGGQVKVHQLPELEKFDPSTGLMYSSPIHSKKQDDNPLSFPKPHGRVILVVRPGVCRYDLPIEFVPFNHRHLKRLELSGANTSCLACKAEVLVETVSSDDSSAEFHADPNDEDVSFIV
ncbi:hypothetical protein AtubIFM57258_010049 [Aspergillus tubingensis]|nr:hypothetical protein AtubIFM57258_010049 [Aspergillus tubingensis]